MDRESITVGLERAVEVALPQENERRVRDVCIAIYRERLGRHPLKLLGYLNGPFAIEREHLDILDLAIDRVKRRFRKPAPGAPDPPPADS